MSTISNPAAARAALLSPPSRRVGRFELREPTLGLLALLEETGSPLAVADAPRTLRAWAETLWAMTRPGPEAAAKLAEGRGAYARAALEWADGVSAAEAAELIRAACASMGRFDEANPAPDPGGDDGDGEVQADPTAGGRTAGSPPAPPRPASASDGASPASSGTCPPEPS